MFPPWKHRNQCLVIRESLCGPGRCCSDVPRPVLVIHVRRLTRVRNFGSLQVRHVHRPMSPSLILETGLRWPSRGQVWDVFCKKWETPPQAKDSARFGGSDGLEVREMIGKYWILLSKDSKNGISYIITVVCFLICVYSNAFMFLLYGSESHQPNTCWPLICVRLSAWLGIAAKSTESGWLESLPPFLGTGLSFGDEFRWNLRLIESVVNHGDGDGVHAAHCPGRAHVHTHWLALPWDGLWEVQLHNKKESASV